MTPEQIDTIQELLSHEGCSPQDCSCSERDSLPAIRALLAEWEGRGREIERLKAELDRAAIARGIAEAEIERLRALVLSLMNDDGKRAEAAEARLAKVVEEMHCDCHGPHRDDNPECALADARALAAAQPKEG